MEPSEASLKEALLDVFAKSNSGPVDQSSLEQELALRGVQFTKPAIASVVN